MYLCRKEFCFAGATEYTGQLLCVLVFLMNPCATVHLNRVYTRPTHKLIWDMCAQLRVVAYVTSSDHGIVVSVLVIITL